MRLSFQPYHGAMIEESRTKLEPRQRRLSFFGSSFLLRLLPVMTIDQNEGENLTSLLLHAMVRGFCETASRRIHALVFNYQRNQSIGVAVSFVRDAPPFQQRGYEVSSKCAQKFPVILIGHRGLTCMIYWSVLHCFLVLQRTHVSLVLFLRYTSLRRQ